MNILEVNNITHIYLESGRKIKVLDDVSFNVKKGSCIGIVGESGCGKSTLAKIISGLQTPTQGSIYYKDDLLNKKNYRKYRNQIQMIFQNSMDALNPYKKIQNILLEPLSQITKGIFFSRISREKKFDIMKKKLIQVNLKEESLLKYPSQFSGGEAQRICIARALLSNPKFLILDEPTSSLDVTIQAQILNLLKKIKKENDLTYILISHNLEAVYQLSDTIVIMYKGQIVEHIFNIQEKFVLKHPYSKRLFSFSEKEYPVIESIKIENIDIKNKGCSYYAKCKKRQEKCKNIKPSLKKISENHLVFCHYS